MGWTVEDIKVSEVSSDVTLCANITSGVLGHTIPPFDVVVVPGTALNGTGMDQCIHFKKLGR